MFISRYVYMYIRFRAHIANLAKGPAQHRSGPGHTGRVDEFAEPRQ
jgi:hypothetical protein